MAKQARFEILNGQRGSEKDLVFWQLKDSQGKVVARGEMLRSKELALEAVSGLKKNTANAMVIDLTN